MKSLSLAYLSRDRFPPLRPDVRVLFGQEFQELGHKVDWFLMAREPVEKSYSTDFYSGRAWVTRNSSGALSRLKNLSKSFVKDFRFLFFGERSYDFVVYKDQFFSAPFVMLACKLKGVDFVYWLSYPYHLEYDLAAKDKGKLITRLRSIVTEATLNHIIIPYSKHLFVQSEGMKDLLCNEVNKDKFTAVPMGFDRMRVENVIPTQHDVTKIAYLGVISRLRKVEFIVHAFSAAVNYGIEAKLCLVGGEEVSGDFEYIESIIAELGLSDKVEMTGALDQKEAWSVVAGCDLCVAAVPEIPLYECSSPTKVVEYMALGKPVVVNNIPDQRLLIEESGAGVCVNYNHEDFANAMVCMLANKEELREMGERGRNYIMKSRTYEHIAAQVEKKLMELL
ncbi:glycosyltransferase involved in cell wall biosynthesis [Sinobacterium caligoides]|uniref:Glycosyltransferase involved in cell wall biosynthesis n=1 Tax=Sinobacterium caligoides TaxID=933926 RepID=A0A3N2DZH6_9GAMM|nr:glycosyltransferase [Sinobacterium caligoides]ROS05052.1 glycosyltransferase involved in cell wall biosynthesis [Sinobacterium caligoides]